MRWLFAVFLLSLCALLWAAFAIARHIRRASQQQPSGDAGAAPSAAQLAESGKRIELQQDIH